MKSRKNTFKRNRKQMLYRRRKQVSFDNIVFEFHSS